MQANYRPSVSQLNDKRWTDGISTGIRFRRLGAKPQVDLAASYRVQAKALCELHLWVFNVGFSLAWYLCVHVQAVATNTSLYAPFIPPVIKDIGDAAAHAMMSKVGGWWFTHSVHWPVSREHSSCICRTSRTRPSTLLAWNVQPAREWRRTLSSHLKL